MKKSLSKGLAGLFFLGTAGITNATTINLWEQFPDSQGDNKFYAYGYAQDTNMYWLLTDTGDYMFNRPQESLWGNPNIYKNNNELIALNPSGTYSNSGHPEDAVLAYVVPKTAYYKLNGIFWAVPGTYNGIDVYIKRDSTTLWSSHLDSNVSEDFDLAKTLLNVGDTIYFGVGAHNYGSFSECNDWGRLKGTMLIDPPESIRLTPAIMLLLEKKSK